MTSLRAGPKRESPGGGLSESPVPLPLRWGALVGQRAGEPRPVLALQSWAWADGPERAEPHRRALSTTCPVCRLARRICPKRRSWWLPCCAEREQRAAASGSGTSAWDGRCPRLLGRELPGLGPAAPLSHPRSSPQLLPACGCLGAGCSRSLAGPEGPGTLTGSGRLARAEAARG